MSQASREWRRQINRKRKLIAGVIFILIAVFIVAGVYRNNQRYLVEKSEYTNAYKTNFFFFKDIDYIELKDFQASDLTLPEGDKTNGYKVLTTSAKVVDQDFLNYQTETIDEIIGGNYFSDWSAVISEISENYAGMAKITTQFEASNRKRKEFLVDSVQFMGKTQEELNQIKSQYAALNDGQPRDITLSSLGMMGTGYVYATLNAMEKVVSESALPYINTEFLKTASKIDTQDTAALKIINNDHIFAAFSVDKDMVIEGEELALANKEEYIGVADDSKNTEYYNFLVKRVDQLGYYQELSFKDGDNTYSGYLVDVKEDGDNKIIILMIKDYVSVFADQIMINTDIYTERFECYKVPQSSIVKQDGETYVKTLEKGYFEDLLPVDVYKYEDGMAILKTDSEKNEALSSQTTIKVYP
ncbi:MAG: hypothetical protein Q4C55_00575 [Eubacterium sp.]|nr:hypothetical protein [Eubacterium sp.]